MGINGRKITRAALYLFMFSINFEMFNLLGDSGTLSVGRLMGYFYIGTLILVNYRIHLHSVINLFYTLMAFTLVIATSSVLHSNSISSKIIDISFLQNVFLFFLFLTHECEDRGVLEKSIYAFALGSIVSSIFYLSGIGVEYTTDGRLSLFGDNENAVGMRMAISSIYLIYLVFVSSGRLFSKKIFMILFVPPMLYIMLETGSRVAYISFVLMIMAMFVLRFFSRPSKRLLPLLALLGLAVFWLVPFLLSNDMMIDRLLQVKEGNLAGREEIWPAFLSAVWKSPAIGYGYSGFEEVSNSIFGGICSPHNAIIEILLYGGFIALIFFLWFISYVLINGVCLYLSRKEYLGVVLMIAYGGLFLSGQVFLTKIMWFILAFNCIAVFRGKAIKRAFMNEPFSGIL